jgi:hypothetical protein
VYGTPAPLLSVIVGNFLLGVRSSPEELKACSMAAAPRIGAVAPQFRVLST